MEAKIVKDSLQKLSEVISFKYPATGWYFYAENVENSFIYKKGSMGLYVYVLGNRHKEGKENSVLSRLWESLPRDTGIWRFHTTSGR